MTPYVECPSFSIDLDLPMRKRYSNVPQSELERGARLLSAIMAEVPAGARYLADGVRLLTRGRFHSEFVALADRIGSDWRSVTLANLTYDLVMTIFGCSTLALATSDGPVLARNMDFFPEDILAQTSALIYLNRKGKLDFANAGWPGTVGIVTAMSSKGFAVALNAVTCSEGTRKTGYPVLLYLRKVFDDATGFDHAVLMLTKQTLASPCLLTVIGTENHQRIVLERTPTRCVARTPDGDKPLVTTNNYRLFEDKPRDSRQAPSPSDALYQTTCRRFDNLSSAFADHAPTQSATDEELLYHLTDAGILTEITAQHVIMRPRQQAIRMFVPRRFVPHGFE